LKNIEDAEKRFRRKLYDLKGDNITTKLIFEKNLIFQNNM